MVENIYTLGQFREDTKDLSDDVPLVASTQYEPCLVEKVTFYKTEQTDIDCIVKEHLYICVSEFHDMESLYEYIEQPPAETINVDGHTYTLDKS